MNPQTTRRQHYSLGQMLYIRHIQASERRYLLASGRFRRLEKRNAR